MSTTVWLTGLPSSGKSTLAQALVGRQRRNCSVEHLDGDEIRADLFPELGFETADRKENIRRIGRLAATLASHGVLVVVSVIAPFRDSRAEVRARHEERGLTFLEVHVDAPGEICAARDVKGLYARAQRGEVLGLTGAGAAYEVPEHPDLRVRTAERGVAECVQAIEDLLVPALDLIATGPSGRT